MHQALPCVALHSITITMSLLHFRLSPPFVSALIFLISLVSCATRSADVATCEQADWYELGRRDGSQGTPTDRLNQHQKECAKSFNPDWETMYTNGRNSGLVEYCDPKNAYELGRLGAAYHYVCPTTVERPFLLGYRKGQDARDLEMQNQKLDEQINETTQKLLQSGDTYEKNELSTALEQLKKLRAKNDRELSKIIAK